ncbi:MAG TPA: family 10 glycosylhydrolase [Blastocatellia bacterium]|nr:family 10 glycosylhydrolase [Blastocatellia bacterium]
MKRAIAIISFYLLALLLAMLPLQQTDAPGAGSHSQESPVSLTPGPTPKPEAREARALWVVRTTMASPESVRSLVRRAEENGFTDLIVQVRGRGDAYYESSLEPRADALTRQPADFDPLALTIEEAHRRGIKVHAWINIYLVADLESLPVSRDHPIYRHPEWVMVPRGIATELYDVRPSSDGYLDRIIEFSRLNRNELEGLFVSPAHPGVKDNLFDIWMDIARRYEVDGLHFDYVRYPNPHYDYSRVSIDRFRQEIEKKLTPSARRALMAQSRQDPLFYVRKFPAAYGEFQRAQVTELVARIYRGVKSVKPNAIISAAVFANEEDAARSRYQDWKEWLRMGWLDVVCPMAYTPDTETFRKQLLSAMSFASGKRVWGGIGAYKQTAESAVEKIRVTRELGAEGFILFSYDSSIKASDLNPQGDYLEKVRDSLKEAPGVSTPH